MANLILIVTFILLLALFKPKGLRSAIIYSSISMGIYAYIVTEVLSLVSKLNYLNLLTMWSLFCLAVFYVLRKKRGVVVFKSLYEIIKKTISRIRKLPFLQQVLLFFILLIVITTLIIAIKAPSNNFDSMAYHLPRVEHWIQNKSIKFYPTNIERQLYMSPYAEISILQVRLLGQSDKFVNLIQWFAMVGSLICVSLIAKEFGLSSSGQLTASAIAVTIPMGILQSTTPQNDYVGTFWAACSILLIIKYISNLKSTRDVIFIGIASGLTLLTKPTSFIFLLPFIIYFFINIAVAKHYREIFLVIIIATLINIPYFYRNLTLFKSPLGPEPDIYSVGTFLPQYLISNSLKNISVHFGTLNPRANNFADQALEKLHKLLNVDINDSRTTYESIQFKIIELSRSENYAGNPHHLFIFLFVTLFIFLDKKLSKKIRVYLLASWCGFLILTTYLRWQPWASRLHLPFFVIISPIVAASLSKFRNVVAYIVIAYFLYTSIPYVTLSSRPLIGDNSVLFKDKDAIIFTDMPKELPINRQIIDFIVGNNFRQVGICSGNVRWEYHFWYMLREKYHDEFIFEHVGVTNASNRIHREFKPQVLINCINLDDLYKPISKTMFGNNIVTVVAN
ncbi:hypothetical protein A3D01_04890 [Candidatus Woesebacteria bacterium RIFCSPHIGHO2_02_FULL_39_13]|uniref:Glycosyltransferase RgtA/B/C/D-like domain-containing protein n=1 Tax=Candidatus Woesebacteria bacterium RIFCSPHIGHO2_02_FULL_39_13 TaxID=1802505 RepID=A0A1F7YZU2_9BACT|nr:MAG: hypothetical protein A2692_00210 [Candidatus Woesebacteria bacterium RIFCSPHIGHO2_01_FULL_39_95]OGM32883.1 MAG: hypothetical protein A3D01_04890 [Candidatus Woesebacteria bacterium RIFCSPHIGHO2_02_FULL_39_13]OGM74396.1 MAG: hypothetical protein A3H19_05200 [Candidatus Woesebacteria bacterium RIFCSPLOWO2_12_FULL_39_9]